MSGAIRHALAHFHGVCVTNRLMLSGLCTSRFNTDLTFAYRMRLCVLYGSRNKQRLIYCTALIDLFL